MLQTQANEARAKMVSGKRSLIALIVAGIVLALLLPGWLFVHDYLNKWTANNLAPMLSKALNRKVSLGLVHWSLGLDRIGVKTNKVDIIGDDDKPFLSAGETNVSVAIFPLIQHKVIVKDVILQHPVFYAKKLTPTVWNCSDLPQHEELQHLDKIVVIDGTVHLLDISTPKTAGYETIIRSAGVAISRPFGLPVWQFHSSFKVPHNTYTTALTLSGFGNGPFKAWANNTYDFSLKVKDINPPDFISVSDQLAYIRGPITANLTAHGVPTKQFSGKFDLLTPGFNCSAGEVKITDIKIGAISAASAPGNEQAKPQTAKPDTAQTATNDSKPTDKVAAAGAGSAQTAKTQSTPTAQTASIFAKAEIKHGALSIPGVPLEPKDFAGNATFDDGLLVLDKIKGKLGRGVFETSGKLLPGKTIDLTCSATNLDLQATRQSLNTFKLHSPTIMQRPLFGVVKTANLNIKGQFGHTKVAIVAVPQDIYSQPAGQPRTFDLTGGMIKATNDDVNLRKLQGNIGNGTYELNGDIGLTPGAPMDLSYAGKNLEIGAVKSMLDELGVTTTAFNPAISGQVEGAVGHVGGTIKQPTVSVSVVPKRLFYQPLGSERMIEIVGGRVEITGPVLRFDKAAGLLGPGKFVLDGTYGLRDKHPIDVHFTAQDLDLSHVKLALLELNVKSPLLAEQMLFGHVVRVVLAVKGAVERPNIDLSCIPQDVRYEPIGSTRPLNLQGGTITYKDDVLTLNKVNAKTARSAFNTDLAIARLSQPNSLLKLLNIQTQQFDITDLHSYLQAPRTPSAVRNQYISILKQIDITPLQGKLRGSLNLKASETAGAYSYQCDVALDNAAATAFSFPVTDFDGRVRTQGNKMFLEKLSGKIGDSPFNVHGLLTDYNDPDKTAWDVQMSSPVDLHDFVRTLYGKSAPVTVESSEPVAFQSHFTGAGDERKAEFTATIDPASEFELQIQGGHLFKPIGEPVSVAGTVVFRPNVITVPDVRVMAGNNQINIAGSYATPANEEPQIDLKMDVPEMIRAGNVLSFVQLNGHPLGDENIGGTLRGRMHIQGPADKPNVRGFVEFNEVSFPQYKVEHLTGRVGSRDLLNTASGKPAGLKLDKVTISGAALKNLTGEIASTPEGDGVALKNVAASVASGTMSVDGTIRESPGAELTFKLQGIDANVLMTQLLNAPNEITGTLDGDAKISCKLDSSDLIKSTTGTINLQAKNGKVTRFSSLQKGINALNLLKGGLLDFNFNNLISTVAPFQSGEYKTFTTEIDLAQGKAEIHHLRYVGDDLMLRAHGLADLTKNSCDLRVAGNIPRVSKSGPLGIIAPYLGVGGITQTVQEVPDLLTGKPLSADSPRVFAFDIKASFDNPKEITQSITKSFKWLTNRPTATPHPAVSVEGGSLPPQPATK